MTLNEEAYLAAVKAIHINNVTKVLVQDGDVFSHTIEQARKVAEDEFNNADRGSRLFESTRIGIETYLEELAKAKP